MRTAKHDWGERFAERGLLLAPATAYMSATAEIAARIAIENAPGIDTLEILSMFRATPPTARPRPSTDSWSSSRSTWKTTSTATWPPLTVLDVTIPGSITTHSALPWGGFPAPGLVQGPSADRERALVWWDPRPRHHAGVIAGERDYVEKLSQLPLAEQQRILSELATAAQSTTPPRENRRENRTVDVVIGRGNLESAHVVIHGTGAYLQTGLIQAFAAHHLTLQPPRKVGFASPGEAFGHRELLGALEGYGFVRLTVIS